MGMGHTNMSSNWSQIQMSICCITLGRWSTKQPKLLHCVRVQHNVYFRERNRELGLEEACKGLLEGWKSPVLDLSVITDVFVRKSFKLSFLLFDIHYSMHVMTHNKKIKRTKTKISQLCMQIIISQNIIKLFSVLCKTCLIRMFLCSPKQYIIMLQE